VLAGVGLVVFGVAVGAGRELEPVEAEGAEAERALRIGRRTALTGSTPVASRTL